MFRSWVMPSYSEDNITCARARQFKIINKLLITDLQSMTDIDNIIVLGYDSDSAEFEFGVMCDRLRGYNLNYEFFPDRRKIVVNGIKMRFVSIESKGLFQGMHRKHTLILDLYYLIGV